MFVEDNSIHKLKVPYGRVLVEIEAFNLDDILDVVGFSDETKGQFIARRGIVHYVNPKNDYPEMNLSFKGECEIQKGDIVYWTQSTIMEAFKHELSDMRVIRTESKVLVVIPYYELILRVREGEYIGLNDKVIARGIKRDSFIDGLDYSMTDIGKPRLDRLEVVWTPSFKGGYNDIYVGSKQIVVNDMVTMCKAGDIVRLKYKGAKVAMLEDETNYTLEQGLVYFKSSQIAEIE